MSPQQRPGFRSPFHAHHLQHVCNIIIACVMAAAIFFRVGSISNPWYQILMVTGGSMQPAIQAGDLILVTAPVNHVRAGDILTFAVNGELVTHRLERFDPDGSWSTRGDWNLVSDDLSGLNPQLVGVYRFSFPDTPILQLLSRLAQPQRTAAWFLDHETIGFHISVEPDEGKPKGTSISADVTASGYKDSSGLAWVTGQVCVTNGGDVPTRGLQVVGQGQYKQKGKGGFQPLGDGFVIEPEQPLEPGETACYDYRSEFSAVQTTQYRIVAAVTITNHSGWMPGGNHCPGPEVCRFGPEPKASFGLVEAAPNEPLLIPTEAPVDEETPVPTEEMTEPTPPTEEPIPTDVTETEPPAETEVTPEPTESATEPPVAPTEPPVEITEPPQ